MLSTEYLVERMGALVKKARLQRNESQEIFAARLGVHRHTLDRMECGDAGIRIGAWVEVLKVLEKEQEFLELLSEGESEDPTRERAWRPGPR